jgi:hypothetical protein
MHVLIPFASASSEVAAHVLRDLALPTLTRLLRQLSPTWRDEADESTLSPPHERALAKAWGWPLIDGALPFAASAAAADGVAVGHAAWCLLTPAHWLAGRDHVTMADPDTLLLDATESRALFDAVRPLFESEGFMLAWGAPLRWYAAHPTLDGLPCASLDRVIGRSIDAWSPKTDQGRVMRRLQSEVQLALYTHPLNDAREARGVPTINSIWFSGCGVHRDVCGTIVERLDALRAPLLVMDWAGWADAWRRLDAGPLEELLRRHEGGEPVSLTLCGDRAAQCFETQPRSLLRSVARRWQAPSAPSILEAL